MVDLPLTDPLEDLLHYEPETGFLFWKARPTRYFKSNASCKRWNKMFAGKKALNCIDERGYPHGDLLGKRVFAHRAIWFLMTSEWPMDQIDHINGDRSDNRWNNLRSVTIQENRKNTKRRADNTSGYVGVSWDSKKEKWYSRIHFDGRSKFLGYFDNKDCAIEARKLSEKAHDFHPNHGR